MELLHNFYDLLLESAPWLLLGLILGGLIKTVFPVSFLNRHLSQNSFSAVGKATILGAPLPLCSCGVVPAAVGLRQAGASKPATVSFLISTPETGVDSISLTYALLGPVMAVARLFSALFSAFTTGLLVLIFGKSEQAENNATENETASPSCCSSNCSSEQPTSSSCGSEQTASNCCSTEEASCSSAKEDNSSCCGSHEEHPKQLPLLAKIQQGMKYTFVDMFGDILLWLLVGIVFAALVQTYVPSDFLTQWGSGFLAMIVMLLIGIPMYVCATASTPIAVGLIMAGISPGVALVFLLSGPATNIGTLGIIAQMLGRKIMWLYVLGTASTALLAGWLLNLFLEITSTQIIPTATTGHEMLPLWLEQTSLAILTLSASYIIWNKYLRR